MSTPLLPALLEKGASGEGTLAGEKRLYSSQKRRWRRKRDLEKMSGTESEISGSFHSGTFSRFLGKIHQFRHVFILEEGKLNKIPVRSKIL